MRRLYISIYIFVIISVLLVKFVLAPVLLNALNESLKSSIEQHNQNLSKGVYYLVQQELLKIPQAEWKGRIEKLQAHFGYPLSLKDYHDIKFSKEQKSRLLAGSIIIIDYGKLFWQRVGSSEYIIGMGPLPDVVPSFPVEIVFWAAVAILSGAVLLIWVFLFWRKLRTVSASAVEFGNGDFGARVNISARSALAPLAGAFNRMADRIQTLIQSHKELTNAVSHELRTPIARIRFGLEMMESTPDERRRETYSEGIHRDVDELDALVSELLIYARFDRETMELQRKEYDIASWLEDLAASFTDLTVKVQYECLLENRAMKVRFDTRQMSRAVGNLLQNAARYGNGKAKLTLEQDEDCILIHVDDNGSGIPVKDRERIFEPFTRLDASRSRESGGFGLGLAIVKRVATCHGGTVTVSDSDLGGSRFSIKWKAF
jgi:signal transduction histidine kinase